MVKEKKEFTIEDLPGVGAATAEKLKESGFDTMLSIAVASPNEIVDIAGVGEAVAKKIIKTARDQMKMGFESGTDLLKKRENVERISSNSKAFDGMLAGGVETGAITECYGAYGSGKCCASDTKVLYFNSHEPHIQSLSSMYEKYEKIYGEESHENGSIVRIPNIEVIGLNNKHLKKTKASHLYREFVEKIYEIKTERGRIIKVTGPHKLLSFQKGLNWIPAGAMKKGDIIAYPKLLLYSGEKTMEIEDAYFLGIYVAEGGKRSISNSDIKIVSWIKEYIVNKFGFKPSIAEDKRRKIICYNIGLRNSTRAILGGLLDTTSGSKYVPESVLLGNDEIVKSFLAGYLDGDGYLPEGNGIEISTHSKQLAEELSYLLLRLGISCSYSTKKVDGETYNRLFVSGKDRELFNDLPFKLKKSFYKSRNSKYGYPSQILAYISSAYKQALGGNRGSKRKIIGKRNINNNNQRYLYDILSKRSRALNINDKTILSVKSKFEEGLELINKAFLLASNIEKLSKEEFKELHNLLPFSFNAVHNEIGIKPSTTTNYIQRGLPKEQSKVKKIKSYLMRELLVRRDVLARAIVDINNAMYFGWDTIKEIKPIEYKDYVYDLVVPEEHLFIGGNMPTVLHNTSIGHQLAVNVQLPKEQGGINGMAIWIDTEGTLRPEFLKKLAVAKGLDPEKALENFRGVRAFNSDHQMLLVDKIEELIKEGLPIKLVIVDSLMGHFRSEFVGRGTLADRQQKLNKHMHALLKLAMNYGIAVYITNQVMAKPDTFFGDPTEAVGGHIVAHNCLAGDTLIQLGDGTIFPLDHVAGPSILPAINSDNLKVNFGFCDWGSKRVDIKEMYKIDTGNKIKASPEHRFFKLDGFNIIEAKAKDLKKGDYLMQVSFLPIEGKIQLLPEIESKKLIKITSEGEEFIKHELERLGLTRKELCEDLSITTRQFRRVLNQGYPTDSNLVTELVCSGVSEEVNSYIEPVETNKYRYLTIPTTLTAELAQILGYYLGDGYNEDRSLSFKDERLEVLEAYKELCRKTFNIDGKISKVKDKNCFELDVNSIAISSLIEKIDENLFLLISKSPNEVVASFIKGFMDAEGYVDKKRPRIAIAQKDEQTLNYIQQMLLRFGIRSRRNINRKKTGETIDVLLFDDKDFYGFATKIGVTASDKKQTMKKWIAYCEKSKQREKIPIEVETLKKFIKECGVLPSKIIQSRPKGALVTKDTLLKVFAKLKSLDLSKENAGRLNFIEKILSSDIRWEKIRQIELVPNNEPLYDISVPLFENYIANGFVTHNSTYRIYLRRGKKGSRVAKLVDAPALPESEAAFVVTEEGIKDLA